MRLEAIAALQRSVRAFVDFYPGRHPAPDPPQPVPPVFGEHQAEADAIRKQFHYADDNGLYQDFPILSVKEQEKFDSLVARWRSERAFKQLFSPKGLENRLTRLLVDCLNSPTSVEKSTADLISSMEVTPKADILLPLIGVELIVDEILLAPDLRLVRMTPSAFERIVVDGYRRGTTAPMPVYGEAFAYGERLAEALRPAFENATTLIVAAEGDENIAAQVAQGRADLVVDYLQYAAADFVGEAWRVYIDWSGDIPARGWRVHGVIPTAGNVMPNNPGSLRGMLAPWQIDDETLAKVRARQLDSVRDAVLAQPRAENQNMIMRATRAFADGERQRSVDGKKLSYVTVFDIFYSSPGSGATRDIREGVAFTMYRRENTGGRFEQAQFVNRVYESRSRTTHEFEKGLFERSDLQRLRLIAVNFIRIMARRTDSFTKLSLLEELAAERVAMGTAYGRFDHLSRS